MPFNSVLVPLDAADTIDGGFYLLSVTALDDGTVTVHDGELDTDPVILAVTAAAGAAASWGPRGLVRINKETCIEVTSASAVVEISR